MKTITMDMFKILLDHSWDTFVKTKEQFEVMRNIGFDINPERKSLKKLYEIQYADMNILLRATGLECSPNRHALLEKLSDLYNTTYEKYYEQNMSSVGYIGVVNFYPKWAYEELLAIFSEEGITIEENKE